MYGKASEHHLLGTTLKKPLIPSEGVSGGGSPFLGEVYIHEVEPCSPSECVWLKTIGRHPIPKFVIRNRYTKFGANSDMSKVYPTFYNLFVSHFTDHVAIQLVFCFLVNMCLLQICIFKIPSGYTKHGMTLAMENVKLLPSYQVNSPGGLVEVACCFFWRVCLVNLHGSCIVRKCYQKRSGDSGMYPHQRTPM